MHRIIIAGLENIAQEMGCSKKTLYKWIRGRGFPAFKMDGVWRALPQDMAGWAMRQRDSIAGMGSGKGLESRSGALDRTWFRRD